MVKLVVPDAVQSDRRAGRYHEIKRRTGRPPIGKWRRQASWCDSLLTHERNPNESAGGVRLELQQPAKVVGGQIVEHLYHRIL